MNAPLNKVQHKASCSNCALSSICLPVAVEIGDVDKLDQIIQKNKKLKKKESLYRHGQEFKSIYAVRSGCIKTYEIDETGDEQITGFYLPGEIFGLDGIGVKQHMNTAEALEDCAICEIPFNNLEDLSFKVPSLQRHFFELMSTEIQNDKKMIMLLARKPANERLASFFLTFSSRLERRKLSGTEFSLPMSRGELANYLGLTIETVSRILKQWQKMELVEVNGRNIVLKDFSKVCHLANREDDAVNNDI